MLLTEVTMVQCIHDLETSDGSDHVAVLVLQDQEAPMAARVNMTPPKVMMNRSQVKHGLFIKTGIKLVSQAHPFRESRKGLDITPYNSCLADMSISGHVTWKNKSDLMH